MVHRLVSKCRPSMMNLDGAELKVRPNRHGIAILISALILALNPADVTSTSLPTHWDWHEQGKVTPVKSQGNCGSDWAFATVAAVESKILILKNLEVDLSEQQLLLCDTSPQHGSCNGGISAIALNYIRDHGLGSESCSPYLQPPIAACTLCPQASVAKIEGYYDIPVGPDLATTTQTIKQAIYDDGPAVALMDVYTDFYDYYGGVYTRISSTYVGGHAILLVGWDDAGGYWIVKNSWGALWGEGGFFRMAYDAGVNLYRPNTLIAVLRTDYNGDGVWDDTPLLASVASRKVHGVAGTFDLPLDSVPINPTTEPRSGPTHTLVFAFDKALATGTATVTEGVAAAGTPSFVGNAMSVPLTGVGNAQYVGVAVNSVTGADGSTGGSGSVRVGFLAGDVTQNRVVTLSDLLAVNAVLTQFVTAANFLHDVNLSGTLTLADKLLVNSKLTQSLPTP